MLSKIRAKKLTGDTKRDAAYIAAIYWYDIIVNHPFTDGNKRTATEAMNLFLRVNGFELDTPPNGFIYTSLKIANGDMPYAKVAEWLQSRIKVMK